MDYAARLATNDEAIIQPMAHAGVFCIELIETLAHAMTCMH